MELQLEDFSAPPERPITPVATIGLEQLEAEKSAAYEQGYSAGWDDATKAEAEAQGRIGTEFARHLQEMSFTFHEARAHVIASVEPVLEALVDTFLPNLIGEAMGPHLLETLEPLIAEQADQPVMIRVAVGQSEALSPFLTAATDVAVSLVEDPTLADGQAFLKIGHVERKFDLTGALAEFRSAMSSFSQLNERVLKHG